MPEGIIATLGRRLIGIPDYVHYVSFHSMLGVQSAPFDINGNYTLTAEDEAALRELNFTATRLYDVLPQYPNKTLEQKLDMLDYLCDRIGIVKGRLVLCLPDKSSVNMPTPAEYADAIVAAYKRGYLQFEMANEPYRQEWGSPSKWSYDATGEAEFLQWAEETAMRVRRVCPNVELYLPAFLPTKAFFASAMLEKRHPELWNGITFHAYSYYTASNNYSLLDAVVSRSVYYLNLFNSWSQYAPFILSEWGNAYAPDNDYQNRNGNIEAVLHAAYRLVVMSTDTRYRFAGHWYVLSSKFSQTGIPPGWFHYTDKDKGVRGMLYYFRKAWMRHAKGYALEMDAQTEYYNGDPAILAQAAEQPDGNISICVVNPFAQAKSAQFTLPEHWRVDTATGFAYTNSDREGSPILTSESQFRQELSITVSTDRRTVSFTMPLQSVNFVTIIPGGKQRILLTQDGNKKSANHALIADWNYTGTDGVVLARTETDDYLRFRIPDTDCPPLPEPSEPEDESYADVAEPNRWVHEGNYVRRQGWAFRGAPDGNGLISVRPSYLCFAGDFQVDFQVIWDGFGIGYEPQAGSTEADCDTLRLLVNDTIGIAVGWDAYKNVGEPWRIGIHSVEDGQIVYSFGLLDEDTPGTLTIGRTGTTVWARYGVLTRNVGTASGLVSIKMLKDFSLPSSEGLHILCRVLDVATVAGKPANVTADSRVIDVGEKRTVVVETHPPNLVTHFRGSDDGQNWSGWTPISSLPTVSYRYYQFRVVLADSGRLFERLRVWGYGGKTRRHIYRRGGVVKSETARHDLPFAAVVFTTDGRIVPSNVTNMESADDTDNIIGEDLIIE